MAQQRIELAAGAGITQPVYLHPASQPIASAVLFPGGSGAVGAVRNNFLLRVADAFAAAGVTAAVADTPSDRPNGMDRSFRATDRQATDTAAIVDFLRHRAPVPVWLIGTSNGTISAANAAFRLGPQRTAGLVLTSAVWDGGIRQVPLGEIRVPTLIVHNRRDGCVSSPFAQAEPALAALTAAPAKELIAVTSSAERSAPCEAKSPHGYLGIEDQVVGLIVAWIKTH
jgi:pimeloyl-ACP methyl ester carboxylesterase